MKVFNPLTVAVGVAFVGGVSAKATQSQTKDLTLDTNIVPTWSQLGTNPNSYKIKLGRVTAYWKEAEERDVSAARSLYSKSSDKNSAEDKVQAFYDGAEKCLGKQSTTDRKLESDINTALGQIKECIKNVKTPVFNVASTVNFPKGYPSSVTVDYSDATKTDEDADLKEYSKSISLDTSLPTWDDLGTNADSYKIKLERLKSYWAAAETRDKKAADSFYAADKNEDAAVNKVKDFYDDAEDCMKKQAETTRKTRSEIDQGLKEIKDCISKKASPLTFTVVKTVKLPSNYDSPLVVDYSKAIKEDEEDDLYEAPKDISLDSDIVPTWDDLGTSANTYKIKLARVSSYWKETEERDISAARSFYSKTADKNAAEDKVEAFYNGAEKCLNKQSTTERKTQSEINTALGQIKNCITKSVTPPVFTVVRITTLPSNYNKPVTVDYTSAIKSDEDADLKEYGKQISLDTALPTWDDLGTNADSYKIKLERLKSYWAVAETRDKKAVAPFYVAEKNDDAAVKKVKDFYDDAEDCMKKQAETTRKTRSEIDQGLQEIKDCITKIATPLTFTVLKTVNLPTNYDAPLVLDFSKAIASDEEADLKEATPAPTPAPPMKQISLDYDIVPTWSQLGTNSKTKKIRLYRIYSYWDKTEARDKKAVKNFYSTTKEDNAAAEKIDDFYDGAKACLAKQKVLERKTRTQVETALQEIKDCIIKSVVPPVFTVLTTVNIPEDYFSLVDNDEEEGYADTNKEDQQEDAAEDAVDKQTTPEITTAPLVTPVATTASPAQLAAPIIEVTPAPYSAPVDNDASSATTQVSPLISPTTTTAPETVPVPIDDKVDYPEQPQQITEPPPETYTGDFTPPEEKDDGYFMPGVPAPEEELPSTDEGTTDVIPPSQGETDDEPPRHYETPQEPTGDVYPPEDTDTGGVTPGVPAPQEEEPSTSEGTETDTGDFYPPTETDNGFVPGVPAPQEEEPSTSEGTETDTGDFYPPTETDNGYMPGVPAPQEEEPSTSEGTETDTGDITPGVPSPEEPTDVTPPIVDPLDIVVDPAAYPVSLPDIPDSEALEWPFSPASPDVPPLWALDLDKSESVDTSEWQQYIEHLHTMARDAAVQGSDPVAVALLKQIVDFHYGSFAQCITSKLKADGISTLTESEYEPVAQWIEKNCYVKFRYSLLAGAPPFEWIAKEKPIVSAQEIEVWFTKRVNTARKDITRLPNVSAAQQEMVERFIGCAYASLNAAGAAPIYRDAFYAVLTHIEQCASA